MRTGAIPNFQNELAPRQTPKRGIKWPQPVNLQNQIQQIKGAVDSPHANVNQVVLNPSSPQTVSGLTIHKLQGETTHQLTVRFKANTQDQYFQGVNVFLQHGNSPPVQVGSGTKSPIRLTVAKTQTPSTVFVQSIGRWGNTPLHNSPARAVNLSGTTATTPIGAPIFVGGGGGGGGGGGATINYADEEIVTFAGTAFTLAHTPSPAASLELVKVASGANPFTFSLIAGGVNYTLVGASGTLVSAALAGEYGVAWYRW